MPDVPLTESAPVVGLIGCGLLGSALAERLLAGGARVHAYDPAGVQMAGVVSCKDVVAVAKQCQWILYCLPNSATGLEVTSRILPYLQVGQAIADTTTGDPHDMESMAQDLKQRQVGYLEVNVAGSSDLLRQGKATLFLGGESEWIEHWAGLLDMIAPTRWCLGAVGTASRFKLVHNLILGLHRAVLAEGLHFAHAMGFDPAKALAVLKQTPASSQVMFQKGSRMVERSYEPPQARVAQHLKDVRLMMGLADQQGLGLPLTQVHESMLTELTQQGLGDLDNSAIAEFYHAPLTD
jgi:3-hydroxyisobutyrate dehydrogenase-like beta-hydroxyacid dehydrogenase